MGGNTSASSITPQNLIDYARVFDWAVPTVGLAGYSREPALTFSNEVLQKIMAKNNPWKWNSYAVPVFYGQPYQYDYPTSISANDMGWLEAATYTDINNPAGTPQYFLQPLLQCVARLQPTYKLGIPNQIAWLMNRNANLGKWPGANSVYQNPLVSAGGGPGSNPIAAISDANGNILVVTTYGTTGSTAPVLPANSIAGTTVTDGTVVWTVQDPNGITFRIDAMQTFGSNVWQFNLLYQKKPPTLTNLSQTFAPVPDDLMYLIKQGFLAYCHRKSNEAEFRTSYAQWLEDIQTALESSDREIQSFGIFPGDALQGGSGINNGGYGYPGYPGWTSGGW